MANMVNYPDKYDVFLSYRRDGGETMAILLRDRLTAKGYRVFLDIESLNSGSFNKKLLSVIEECTDIVVVCSKNSLDRCANEGDWVRMEIAHALKHGKNIVPVLLRGFEWPATLPDDIDVLRMQNGINAGNNEYFDAAIDRLTDKFLLSGRIVVPPGYATEEIESSGKSFAVDTHFARKTWWYVVLIVLFAVLVTGGITLLVNGYFDSSSDNTGVDSNMTSQVMSSPQKTETKTDTQVTPNRIADSLPSGTVSQTTVPPPEPVVDFITIRGKRYSTSLFELDLSTNGLSNSDIIPVRHMINLEVLNLSGNQISDLTPLSGLKKLKVLFLYDNKRISDLSPLSSLKNLTDLGLYDNRISDLSPLSNLTNLTRLTLDDNQISDLSPLENLVNLTELGLRYNKVSDLKPLSGLRNLKKLNLGNNQIRDLSPVDHVPVVHGR